MRVHRLDSMQNPFASSHRPNCLHAEKFTCIYFQFTSGVALSKSCSISTLTDRKLTFLL